MHLHLYIYIYIYFVVEYLVDPHGKVRSPYLAMTQQLHSYWCVSYFRVQAVAWLPVFGIFNVRIDVDACNCTRYCT